MAVNGPQQTRRGAIVSNRPLTWIAQGFDTRQVGIVPVSEQMNDLENPESIEPGREVIPTLNGC